MVAQLLLYKIFQLFIIMILGFALVKTKLVKSEDSIILSKLSLYLFMPSVILNAFNVDLTDDVVTGLAYAFLFAFIIHIILLILDIILKKCFKSSNVERASIMYSNAGNLIVPIVTYVLGEEYLIYSSAFIIVQLIFLWTHGVKLFSDEKINLKKIFTNINIVTIIIGFALLFSGVKLPDLLGDTVSTLGSMLAPAGMIIAGMLAASVKFGEMIKRIRLYFVTSARLVIYPVIIMFLFKIASSFVHTPIINTVMLISYFACITPSAATIMQFSQVYGKDSDYATAINVFSTVLCIVTMPLLVMVFNY
ncbi:MAG: AEC family transporter [Clostridia bacterium]|nr:AEC family transporter [Clostridia bacterium]